jgi:hypothetical protein
MPKKDVDGLRTQRYCSPRVADIGAGRRIDRVVEHEASGGESEIHTVDCLLYG